MLQEMQAKVTALEQEVEQWKQTALLPKTRGDLSTWIEKVEVLFSRKKSIHQEILTLESKEKLLKWRINHKLDNAEQISVYEDSEDEVSSAASVSILEVFEFYKLIFLKLWSLGRNLIG